MECEAVFYFLFCFAVFIHNTTWNVTSVSKGGRVGRGEGGGGDKIRNEILGNDEEPKH